MKHRNLSLILAFALVVLMSLGIVAYAETATGNAKEILLTDGERIFETDGVNILEEGWLRSNLKINPLDEVSKVAYTIDEDWDNKGKTILADEIEESIRIKKEFTIGTVHTLNCVVTYTDGSSVQKNYTFKSVTRHKNYDQLCMNVKLNGECIYQEHYYNVEKGDVISVDVETFYEDMPVCFTSYYWADADTWKALTDYVDFYDEDGEHLEIGIPEEYFGTRKALIIESVLKTNQGRDDATRRSGWQIYYINLGENITLSTKLNGEDIYTAGKYTVKGGDKVTVSATPLVDSDISFIGYYYAADNPYRFITDVISVAGNKAEIILPDEEPGTELYLYIEPVDKLDDGRISHVTKTGWKEYTLVWGDDT